MRSVCCRWWVDRNLMYAEYAITETIVASLFSHNHAARRVSLSHVFEWVCVRAHVFSSNYRIRFAVFFEFFFSHFVFVILCRHRSNRVCVLQSIRLRVQSPFEYRCHRSLQSELSMCSCLHYSAIMYTNQNPSDMYNYSAVFVRRSTLLRTTESDSQTETAIGAASGEKCRWLLIRIACLVLCSQFTV